MKKTFLTAFLAFGVMLSASVSFGQTTLSKALIGTPDEYQDYFVFNKFGNMTVVSWLVEINVVVNINDSTTENRLRERIRLTDRSFYKLAAQYKSVPIHVEIRGFNSANNLVAYDEWDWLPAAPGPQWRALCSATCVAPTYALTITVDAQFEENSNVRTSNNNYHVRMGFDAAQVGNIGNFGGNPVGIWRNFRPSEKTYFCSNGDPYGGTPNPNNFHANVNAPRHHGHNWCPDAAPFFGSWNGVDFMFVPSSAHNGNQYKNYLGQPIPTDENVYRIRKGWGQWGEFQGNLQSGSHSLTPGGFGGSSPETQCGQFPTSGMGGLLQVWNPYFEPLLQKDVNGVMVTVPLVCQSMPGGGGPTGSGPGNEGYGKWPFIQALSWWYTYKDTIKPVNPKPVFEILSDIQHVYIQEFEGQNTTGVSWWPGDDITMIQIYKVDQNPNALMNEPVTLTPDMLIDADGNIVPLSFTLYKGLYNIVFFDEEYSTVRYLFELDEDVEHNIQKADFVDITIFPNPFDANNNQITTRLESSINTRYTYTIVDANNTPYHQSQGLLRQNDELEVIIRTQNLPAGQLFHKFVFDDGSFTILQTLKN
jgi:hypothetical protein